MNVLATVIAMCITGLLWLALGFFLVLLRGGGYLGGDGGVGLSLAAGLSGFALPALVAWLVRPRSAALAGMVGLPLGTLLGYILFWNVHQTPASGFAGMLAGAAAGTLLGVVIGRGLNRRLDSPRVSMHDQDQG